MTELNNSVKPPTKVGDWVIHSAILASQGLDLKGNKYEDTSANIYKVLTSSINIHYDEFTDSILLRAWEGLRPINDSDYVKAAMALTTVGFKEPSKDRLRDVIRTIAKDNKIDSAKEWALDLKWDGVKRCEKMFSTYFGCPDTEWTRAVGNYFSTAMAGRILNAGTKADSVPIIVGKQGSYKSTAMAALAPFPISFGEIDLSQRDDNLARQIKGKLIIAIDELRGFGAKEVTSIKHFITRQEDEWRPLWSEFTTKVQRRCVFIASTNDSEFLTDVTGNRRYFPLVQDGNCDPVNLSADKDQIWAESIELFKEHGVLWADAANLCSSVHQDHFVTDDVLIEQIEASLPKVLKTNYASGYKYFVMADLVQELYGENHFTNRLLQVALSAAATTLGFKKTSLRVDGKQKKVWIQSATTSEVVAVAEVVALESF